MPSLLGEIRQVWNDPIHIAYHRFQNADEVLIYSHTILQSGMHLIVSSAA